MKFKKFLAIMGPGEAPIIGNIDANYYDPDSDLVQMQISYLPDYHGIC